jgi:hypothetical protein
MSLVEKLKAEKEKMEKEKEKMTGDFLKVDYFKPEKGKNFLRIVENPVRDERGQQILWVEKTVHYGLPILKKDGTKTLISARCLKDFGEDCPMCEEYERLMDIGEKTVSSQIKPQKKYFYNVISYSEKKAKVLMAGQTIHSGVVALIDYGCDFWDLEKGLDLNLTKDVDPSKPSKFGTSYKLSPAKLETTSLPVKLREELNSRVNLLEILEDNLRDKMLEAFGGKKKPSHKVEEVEEYYGEEEEEEEPKAKPKVVPSKVVPSKVVPSKVVPSKVVPKKVVEEEEEEEDYDDSDSDDLDKELAELGL